MSCASTTASLDLCPTQDEIQPQLLALLPQGRAWGTHDGGPFPGSTLYQFWYAVAGVWAWVNQRICDLSREFFCATQSETHDTWLEEYGLPDGCDPYPDLCSKVKAIGGTRCEYYQEIATQAGWSIRCTDINTGCSVKAGRFLAGGATIGHGLPPSVYLITVALSASPAYVGGAPAVGGSSTFAGLSPPLAGRMQAGGLLSCPAGGTLTSPFAGALQAGRKLACPIDLSALECLLTRIVGGHIHLIFETTP